MADQVLEQIQSHGANALAVQADLGDSNFGTVVVKATLEGFSTSGIDILGKTSRACYATILNDPV